MFDPKLTGVPVIVLSNNDDCAIPGTAEAKALGIRMREPYFKIRDLCRRQKVRVFPSNYALYGEDRKAAFVSARCADHTRWKRFYPIPLLH